jgi:hypothetical protein
VDAVVVAFGMYICSSGKFAFISHALSLNDHKQHLGGIHSGCALSGVLWLLLKVVNMFRTLDVQHDAVLVWGVVTNLAVMISALSAFPWVRNTHHK